MSITALPSATTTATAAALLAAGGLHAIWATGTPWPCSNTTTLNRYVVGQADEPRLPGPLACLAVTGALTVTAAAALHRATTPHRHSAANTVAGFVLTAASTVLALRSAIVVATTTMRPQWFTPEFVKLDRAVYSPLCLSLAIGLRSAHRAGTPS